MPLAFHIHSGDTYNFSILARYMATFRKAVHTLKQYYDMLQPLPSLSNMSLTQLFPYPTAYTSVIDGNRTKKIVYQRQLSEDKLVFFGTQESDGQPICIKFVQQYSTEAHNYCAVLGCTPTLMGFEVVGGWFMVVMENISKGHDTLFSKQLSMTTKALIADKLKKFHQAGFVHGDIRDTNIMVSNSDEKDFKIIDFDWAGRVNEARYPSFINRQIWRPSGAVDGQPILPAHDLAMLDHIGLDQ